jgi:glycine cleavage system H protein
VTGEVTAVNEELNDDPALINAEPYHLGWIFRVRLTAAAEAATGLLSPSEYEELTSSAS